MGRAQLIFLRASKQHSMTFPVYLHFGPLRIHPHWFFEALADAVSFRVYLQLRRHKGDAIPDADRPSTCAP
jgi:hypothetical protein